MANQLELRNMLGSITDQLTGTTRTNRSASGSHNSDDSNSDDDNSDDDNESDGNEAALLVRSTISRDTTHNTLQADMLDLSKLAAQTNELLLNARGTSNISGAPPKQPQSPPPKRSAPRPIPPAPSNNFPSAPLRAPLAPIHSLHSGSKPSMPKPPIPLSPYTRGTTLVAAPRSILAEIHPGHHWRSLFEQTWTEPTNFARYNWRESLRATGRRKSESDLSHYRGEEEEEDGSWISQYLPPNASRAHLVDSWKRAGRAVKKTNGGAIPLDSSYINHQPDFGAITGRAAETNLGVDLYSNTRQSMFVGYLLDNIETLRMERDFLEDILTKPRRIELPQIAVTAPSNQPVTLVTLVPKLKILHRVYCKTTAHEHDGTVYEDLPTRVLSEKTQDLELVGKKIISNLTQYYSQNPEISFVVFKEHICVENSQGRVSWRQQRKGRGRSEISPRAERLQVIAILLQTALDEVASCPEPESSSTSTGTCEMAAPYLFFYHHREQLKQYAENATGIVKQHVMVLLEFLESDHGAEYREADIEFSTGNLTPKHIEKLYCPNDIVIEKSEEYLTAYVLKDWPEIVDKQMRVACWTWHYDGDCLQRHDAILSITLHEISTLDKLTLCPIKYANVDNIKVLRDRGRNFWKMRDHYFGCFSGRDSSRKTEIHEHLRVVVDMSTYSRMHPLRDPAIYDAEIDRLDHWPRKIPRDKMPDDNMIMLCPPTVFGFMLQEKTWMKLDVNGIHEIEWNKLAFDRLVLDSKTKELITALVKVKIATGRMEDVIGGKGNGLMILLHGGPGTGKTLTAESVAEIAEKPLYRVTCGDIGTKAADVERYLSTVLYLGKIWDCVLLLDEADIFLEERTIADLERNSLVSVFLRILEYYNGILIMTSNRVGTFDEAFKSRIQVSLHYEDLSKKSRKTIWSNFITILADGDEDVNINDLESHLDEAAQEEMNGRQIRNAMTTARQLALHRKERLQWEHLDQVLKTARDFNQYLKNVQGHTDKQWARAQRLR